MRSASRPVTASIRARRSRSVVSRAASRSVGAGSKRARNSVHQPDGDGGLPEQRVGHVLHAVGAAELAGVAGVGAQHRDLTPRQPGPQHQRGEPVGLRVTAPGGAERRAEPGLDVGVGAAQQRRPGGVVEAQPEVVDEGPQPVGPHQLRRALVGHVDPELLQQWQHRGQRGGGAGQVEREAPVLDAVPGRAQPHREVPRRAQRDDPPQVLDGLGRLDDGLVSVGNPGQLRRDGRRAGGREQPIVPAADGRGQLVLQPGDVHVGEPDRVGRRLHGEVDEREMRLRHPRGVVHRGAAEPALQHVGHGQPGGGRVAVAGQVDQAGQEPAVRIGSHEQPDGSLAAHREHADGRVVQAFLARAEQLLARQPGDHLEHLLAGVGLQWEPGAVDGVPDPPLDDGDVEHALVQGGDGQGAQEAVLAGGPPGGIDGADGQVVRGSGPQRARRAGPGDHEQVARGGAVDRRIEPRRERVGILGVRTEHPEAPLGRRPVGQVAPVPEEGEVPVGEPAQ